MIRRAIVLCSAVLLAPFTASAQATTPVTGTVRAAGTPLAGVRLSLLNTGVVTRSDSLGRFRLQPPGPGRYTLLAQRPGYAALTRDITAPTASPLALDLAPAPQQLAAAVVTADRREERADRVPGSLTVLDADRVQAARVWELRDLPGLVPNLQWSDQGVPYQAILGIRGIAAFSDEPAVATYVDGVPAFDIAGNGLSLVDIERIEVLRGPQGTQYGRNALGGVINIVTRPPGNERRGSVETGIGNLGLTRLSAAFRTPLVRDRLFLSVSAQRQQRDGFYRNDLTGTPIARSGADDARFGDNTATYAAAALRWLPGGAWSAEATAKAQQDRSARNSGYFAFAPSDSIAFARPFTLARDQLGRSERRLVNGALSVRHDGARVAFQSVTSAQHIGFAYRDIDFDGTPTDVFRASSEHRLALGAFQPQTILNQELRLASAPGARSLRWVAGVAGFRQSRTVGNATDYRAGAAALFPPAVAAQLPFATVQGGELVNTGSAVFGEATWLPTARLELTAGARWDREVRRGTAVDFTLRNGVPDYNVRDADRRATFRAVSPRAAIVLRPDDRWQLSATWARGFRAGGINLFTPNAATRLYEPETSDNVEVGMKGAWLDRRLLVNASLFRIDWRDQQLIFAASPGDFVVGNLGRVRSQGGELEIVALPWRGIEVQQALGITDARYRALTFLGEDRTGNRAYYTPAYTSTTALQLARPLPGRPLLGVPASWQLRTELQAFGRQYFDVANTIAQAPVQLVHLRGAIDVGRWTVAGFVRNATDRRYLGYASPTFFTFAQLAPPRTYGMTVGARF
ncbi:MAG: TonB-dependent receptor [Gemmatimonadaceae bacterium]|nr:TonB-dependent receptor [Gemmatimonadaceae bacterium]